MKPSDNSKKPIGVFDSGAGGLTVVSRLLERMPEEKIIYFGDTARVPYGGKSVEAITRFSVQICDFLMKHDVKAIVVACNTVSSTCLSELVGRYDVPIFGVVEPGVLSVIDLAASKGIKKAVIIGTERTVKSEVYKKQLNKAVPELMVYQKACPLFVPIVEEGFAKKEIATLAAKEYLAELRNEKPGAVLLGCTHYPILYDTLSEFFGEDTIMVDPALRLAEDLQSFLEREKLSNPDKSAKQPEFFVSDNGGKFAEISLMTLRAQYPVKTVQL